jgi:uncharacterized protein (DUF1501 family)
MGQNMKPKCSDHILSRRNLLTIGAVGGLGLSLPDYFRLQSAQAATATGSTPAESKPAKEGTAKSVIFIFLPGGMAQQESFDPKPYAPLEYRGPLESIPTKIAGEQIGEMFRRTAGITDKLTIIRSMTHGEAAHERGVHNMHTGYRPSPALQYPSMGSVLSHEFGPRNNLPPYVLIPGQTNPYQGSGYLNSSFSGFSVGGDPSAGNFKVRDLELPSGVKPDRFAKRRRLLDVVNNHFRETEKSGALDAMDTFYQRAYSLISSEKARLAFDLNKEDKKTRDTYGRNQAGARMLMARRLVEAGVRFVSMTYGAWDHHDKIDANFKRVVPSFDQAYAALINDLEQRGLLDSTLVCLCSEFGRSPKINQNAGRDHWPKVFSSVLAGGGVKRGLVYGSSNATASEPENDPVSVEDWATTVYKCLGIDAGKELMAPGGRPIEIVARGRVIRDLLV